MAIVPGRRLGELTSKGLDADWLVMDVGSTPDEYRKRSGRAPALADRGIKEARR
jgi:hypothetical protein